MIVKKAGLTSADFEEITSGTNYRLMFSGLSIVVAKDTTKTLTFKVSVPSVQDSATDSTITFTANCVRGTDSAGLTQQAPTADLAATRTIDFTAKTAGELEITANTANVEKASIISTSETTSDVVLGQFDIKAKSNSATIKTLKVTVTATDKIGSALDESLVMPTIKLYDGTVLLSSQSVADGGAITFDELNIAIAKDTTKTLTLKGDFVKVRAEGDRVIVALTKGDSGVTQNEIVAEDANYDTITTITATTAITKMTHVFSKAPILTFVNSSIALKADSAMKQADATITFKLKANGGDIYFEKDSIDEFGTVNEAGNVIDNTTGASQVT